MNVLYHDLFFSSLYVVWSRLSFSYTIVGLFAKCHMVVGVFTRPSLPTNFLVDEVCPKSAVIHYIIYINCPFFVDESLFYSVLKQEIVYGAIILYYI